MRPYLVQVYTLLCVHSCPKVVRIRTLRLWSLAIDFIFCYREISRIAYRRHASLAEKRLRWNRQNSWLSGTLRHNCYIQSEPVWESVSHRRTVSQATRAGNIHLLSQEGETGDLWRYWRFAERTRREMAGSAIDCESGYATTENGKNVYWQSRPSGQRVPWQIESVTQ